MHRAHLLEELAEPEVDVCVDGHVVRDELAVVSKGDAGGVVGRLRELGVEAVEPAQAATE